MSDLTKKTIKIKNIFIFYYLKPWQSSQVVHFLLIWMLRNSNQKFINDKILSVIFDLGLLKMNIIALEGINFAMGYHKDSYNKTNLM